MSFRNHGRSARSEDDWNIPPTYVPWNSDYPDRPKRPKDEGGDYGDGNVSNSVGIGILVIVFSIIIIVGSSLMGNPIWSWFQYDNLIVDEMILTNTTGETTLAFEGMAFDWSWVGYAFLTIIVAIFLLSGIKIIRPTHRAAIETLGKYSRFQASGITWIIPIVQKLYKINITEQLVDVEKQETITSDNLNAEVDAQIYFKVKDDEASLKNALYSVNNYHDQIVQLARTTLRNVIGTKVFKDVNSKRNELNADILAIIGKQTEGWGIGVVRSELKEIKPPTNVQDTMNRVIQAQNTKDAEIDFATAVETKADGLRRARIKEADGIKQSQILEAEGQAKAIITVAEANARQIELVNTAAKTYFVENAVLLKQLEVTQASLQNNSKIILTKEGISPTLVINESDAKIITTSKSTTTPKSTASSSPNAPPKKTKSSEMM